MEELLKRELNTSKIESLGASGGGCISEAQTYITDKGKVFVKTNRKSGASKMFKGEFTSLDAISATDTVKVPKPYKVFDLPGGGAALVIEYLDLKHGLSKYSGALGEQLANLHLHNAKMKSASAKCETSIHKDRQVKFVDKFGFDVVTCCGYLQQSNSWEEDWIKYYGNKLEEQICMAESEYGDREARELWNTLLPSLSKLFLNLQIEPALLHGDLWGGNASETSDGPVIYDPASFYGHSEYDLAISHMFGGFDRDFFAAYHKVIPKAEGYQNRLQLYKLFHYLNHWNHFGGGYRGSSISILKSLTRITK